MDGDPFSDGMEVRRGSSRMVPFLIVIGGCLAAGILLGALAGGKFSLPEPSAEPPAVFVLLGYDNLNPTHRLESIWELKLNGKGGALYTGVSPATVLILENGQPAVLRDFLGEPLSAPSRMFKIPFIAQPSTSIEFDDAGLAAIINRSGGITFNGRTIHGQEASALATAGETADPLTTLRFQARMVEALFGTAGPCLSESTLAGLSPDHLIVNVPMATLIAECVARGPYMADAVQVNIMDSVMPMDLPDGSVGLLPAAK